VVHWSGAAHGCDQSMGVEFLFLLQSFCQCCRSSTQGHQDRYGMAEDQLVRNKHLGIVVRSRGESSTHCAVDDLDEHRRCIGFLPVLQQVLQQVEYHAEEPSESGAN